MTDNTTYRCRDCDVLFTDNALADAHISETLAAAKTFSATARSHTIVHERPSSTPAWTEDIAAMFDNMRTLN